ncbi:lytic murein transglycosylase B [Lysobacter sp. A3-1-A15]|uniref:lytic murein transglycosylase B n=1 Tax=Novilysobacter viscosus TaxID=3098602 RepID=UPI0039834548
MTSKPFRNVLPFTISLVLGACATPAPPAPVAEATHAESAPAAQPAPRPMAKPTRTRPPVPGTSPLPDPLPAMPLEQAKAAFVRDTADKYGVDPSHIRSVLAGAEMRESIIKAMSRPAEAKPWRDYRPIFISQARIDGGQAFMARNRDALARVESRTGVPAEIIVAIIGVETSYGANAGSYPVVDSLYTLAFAYPRTGDPARADRENRREAFFRGELAQLFALGKEQRLDITTLKGSYAGAMGWGQFMPSSYREFAADGDGDGRIDLFNNTDDVFASIANYFVEKGGWTRGGPVAVRATRASDARDFEPEGLYPDMTVAQLAQMGYRPTAASIAPDEPALLINLDGVSGREHWLGFDNFYAITRYNISKHYAMAVFQLSEAIAGRENPLAGNAARAAHDGA